jgi:hypothetical protein
MFGMLDYRAHKLLKLFTVPVTLVFALIHNIVLPIAAIAIAAGYATSWKFPQLPIAIAALLLLMIPYQIVLWSTFAFLKAAFNFVIDAVPADGRTKDQAASVVAHGNRAVKLLKLDATRPENWTDDDIEDLVKLRWFYRDTMRKRLRAVRSHWADNPDLDHSAAEVSNFLYRNNMQPTTMEEIGVQCIWFAVPFLVVIAISL